MSRSIHIRSEFLQPDKAKTLTRIAVKLPVSFLLAVLFFRPAAAQNEDHDQYIQALARGDTALAAKTEALSITTEPIQKKPLPIKNVPEQVFHFGINQLRDTIVSFFNLNGQFDSKVLASVFYNKIEANEYVKDTIRQVFFSVETSKKALFGKNYFSRPGTENDIFIHAFGETWPSKLYFSGNKPLQFRTTFAIQLSAQGGNSTKLNIVALNPTVLNGVERLNVHGAVARETSVQASSIEEYTLLLFIAGKIGVSLSEPLKLPGNR